MQTPLIYKTNRSKRLEVALIDTPQQQKCEKWLAQNRVALNTYNKRIEERGVFSEGLRRF